MELKRIIKKALDNTRLKKEMNTLKKDLQPLVSLHKYNDVSKLLEEFALRWKMENNQHNFGNFLQDVLDWKLDYSKPYKQTMMGLGRKYNVLGLIFRH